MELVKVNGIDINYSIHDGEYYVAIKPICQALGIDHSVQIKKLKEHPLLSSPLSKKSSAGSDGKQYKMTSLPLKYVFGWLMTINPANIAEKSRDALIAHQRESIDSLYNTSGAHEALERLMPIE